MIRTWMFLSDVWEITISRIANGMAEFVPLAFGRISIAKQQSLS